MKAPIPIQILRVLFMERFLSGYAARAFLSRVIQRGQGRSL
jgi:hypothetical protein